MRVLLAGIVFFSSFFIFGQNYKVVHLSGELVSSKTNKKLKIGDEIGADEMLLAKGEGIKCLLFNGKTKLTFNASNSKKEGQLDDLFSQSPDRQLIGSRGDNDSAYVKISDFFINDNYLFMDSVEQILLNEDYIKDLGSNKFLIVDTDDKKSLIEFKDSKLTLEISKIFKEGETKTKISIYRVNTSTGEFIKEVDVNVSLLNKEKMVAEVETIKSLFTEETTQEELIKGIYSVLIDIYGGLNFQDFKKFYLQNF